MLDLNLKRGAMADIRREVHEEEEVEDDEADEVMCVRHHVMEQIP